MSERDWAAEARELVDAWVTTLDTQAGSWLTFDDLLRLRAATESSLRAAAAVPAGCVRDDKGVVRKVLGTLPVTGDGCVVAPNGYVWVMPPHCANPAGFGFRVMDISSSFFATPERDIRWQDCYSTREAAQAALAAREGK